MNEQLKPFKTVEEIAKKHRLDVSFIQKQLEMGEPIEHEHTKNRELAREIALQHLDEIPDYYTRLKKMEADAKKHHKKFKDVKVNEDLRNWFSKSHPEGNWKRYNSKGEAIGPCAREPGEPKPKCLSNEKAAKMSKDEIAASVRRKREKDPVADRKGKGGKPIMSSNKIDEGLLDRLRGRKVIGRTGSGGKVYVSTKPKKSTVTYGGKSQKDIEAENKQKKVDVSRKDKVSKGKYDDPWLKHSPAAERRVHYQQLRGEAKEEQRYCMKCKKMETRDECSYGPEMWDKMTVKNFQEAAKKSQPDHEHSMARSELSTVMNAVKRLKKKMKGEGNIEAWVQSKITKAADYLDSAADYLDSGEHNVDEACWTGYKQVGMKKKGKKIVPNCVPEETNIEEENKPTNPALWSRAKALAKKKFDVYPSAYANGWASKWYKSKGGGWKSVKEETIEDLNGENFVEVIDLILPDPNKKIEESTRISTTTGNLMMVVAMWRGKTYALRIFFPQAKIPSRKEVEEQIQKVYPGSRVVYTKVTEQEPGQPFLYAGGNGGSLGPSKKYVKPYSEDWQKVNKQDETDGMSQKAVNAYRRENPGSKLKTAVTEKDPGPERSKRRKSFCARSKGQQDMHNIDCSKTPDKAICKARRRWKC